MTDEERDKMLRDVHDFLLKETVPGTGVTRAKQIDELLTAARSGKFVARFALWGAGSVVAIGSAWVMLRGGK